MYTNINKINYQTVRITLAKLDLVIISRGLSINLLVVSQRLQMYYTAFCPFQCVIVLQEL